MDTWMAAWPDHPAAKHYQWRCVKQGNQVDVLPPSGHGRCGLSFSLRYGSLKESRSTHSRAAAERLESASSLGAIEKCRNENLILCDANADLDQYLFFGKYRGWNQQAARAIEASLGAAGRLESAGSLGTIERQIPGTKILSCATLRLESEYYQTRNAAMDQYLVIGKYRLMQGLHRAQCRRKHCATTQQCAFNWWVISAENLPEPVRPIQACSKMQEPWNRLTAALPQFRVRFYLLPTVLLLRLDHIITIVLIRSLTSGPDAGIQDSLHARDYCDHYVRHSLGVWLVY